MSCDRIIEINLNGMRYQLANQFIANRIQFKVVTCKALRKSASNTTVNKVVVKLEVADAAEILRGPMSFVNLQRQLFLPRNQTLAAAVSEALSLVRCRVQHLEGVTLKTLASADALAIEFDEQEEVMNQFVKLCAMVWRVQKVRTHQSYLQKFWMKDYREAIEGHISFFRRMRMRDGKWVRAKRKYDWTI